MTTIVTQRNPGNREGPERSARKRSSVEDGALNRSAFTILELLISIGIVGVLVALVLPAVHSVREAARKTQCSSQLRQLGLALHAYHDSFGGLPPGWQLDPSRQSAFAWAVSILPSLEQQDLQRQIPLDLLLDSPESQAVRQHTPAILMCPSDIMERTFPLDEIVDERPLRRLMELPAASYVAVFGISEPDEVPGHVGEGPFLETRSIRFAELQRGLTATLLVGERTARRLPSTWLGFHVLGEDAPCRVLGNAFLGPNADVADECEFDSRHPGCVQFLWADGHVKPVANSIDQVVYRQMATRSEILY